MKKLGLRLKVCFFARVKLCRRYALVLELLASKGAEVDLRNEHERTPLWAACYHGNTAAMQALMKLNADPNAQDATFASPLIAAVGLYKLNPEDPELESAWFQPFNLSSEKLVSTLQTFK